MARSQRESRALYQLDLHLVALLLILIPLAWFLTVRVPWYWLAAALFLLPQGRILVQAGYDLRRSERSWVAYLVVNEILVLLGVALLVCLPAPVAGS